MDKPNLPLPGEDLGLFTDLYELTMAQVYFKQGMFGPATFSLFVRQNPPDRGYLVSAGLEDVLAYLANLNFSSTSLDYLRSTGIFAEDFLGYLAELRFTGSVRAMPEGRLFFANEPLMEVTAPLIEAQLAETFIVNQINLQSLLATKAARCVWAAQGRVVSDFASRRTQGVDAALKMARCSYIAGFQSTSNVLAAQRYGIPPAGTMAHSYISSFASESEAFLTYARTFPKRTVLLLDTYDTVQGAHRAIKTAKDLEAHGHHLLAVRLDSGDFDSLSRQVRHILDGAGLEYVQILASGGLDEFQLESLSEAGAPIDIFGVGTKAGVSADAPWSDMVYKIVSYNGRPVMKLSTDKESLPGAKQVFRMETEKEQFSQDVIGLQEENVDGGIPLLSKVMESGTPTATGPSLTQIRELCCEDLSRLERSFKALKSPPEFSVTISPGLQQLTTQIREEILKNQ